MAFVRSISLLLLCQWLGTALASVTGLPLPGPVIGIVLLLLVLVVLGQVDTSLEGTAGLLLSHMSLLFIPAGTGVIVLLSLISEEWLPIIAAMVVSTFLGMATTGLIVQRFEAQDSHD